MWIANKYYQAGMRAHQTLWPGTGEMREIVLTVLPRDRRPGGGEEHRFPSEEDLLSWMEARLEQDAKPARSPSPSACSGEGRMLRPAWRVTRWAA